MRPRLAAALLLATACDGYVFAWDGQAGVLMVGVVGNGGVAVIESADTVTAGQAFAVTVNTFGSSSCVTAERLDVAVEGLQAELTPWDRVAPAGTACTADYMAHPHTAKVTFPMPGTGTLAVRGRTADGDTVVTRSVTVR